MTALWFIPPFTLGVFLCVDVIADLLTGKN